MSRPRIIGSRLDAGSEPRAKTWNRQSIFELFLAASAIKIYIHRARRPCDAPHTHTHEHTRLLYKRAFKVYALLWIYAAQLTGRRSEIRDSIINHNNNTLTVLWLTQKGVAVARSAFLWLNSQIRQCRIKFGHNLWTAAFNWIYFRSSKERSSVRSVPNFFVVVVQLSEEKRIFFLQKECGTHDP